MTLWIFLDNIIVWAPSIYFLLKVLAWEICNMKWGFAKKVIIKSQRQFMYGSNFYGSEFMWDSHNHLSIDHLWKNPQKGHKMAIFIRKTKCDILLKARIKLKMFKSHGLEILAKFTLSCCMPIVMAKNASRIWRIQIYLHSYYQWFVYLC